MAACTAAAMRRRANQAGKYGPVQFSEYKVNLTRLIEAGHKVGGGAIDGNRMAVSVAIMENIMDSWTAKYEAECLEDEKIQRTEKTPDPSNSENLSAIVNAATAISNLAPTLAAMVETLAMMNDRLVRRDIEMAKTLTAINDRLAFMDNLQEPTLGRQMNYFQKPTLGRRQ